MDEDKRNALKKFVNDPEWHYMEQFLEENLGINDSIQTIDTTKADGVIIGEVMASQRITKLKNGLFSSLNTLKAHEDKEPRRKLK